MYVVSIPALYGAAYFVLQYLTTLCLRPNTWRIHWSTVALGYGLLASLLLFAAGMLLGRWLEGTEWQYTLPQWAMVLPELHGELSTPLGELGEWQWPTVTWEARSVGGEQLMVAGAWWLPGKALAALVLLLYVLQQLWHCVGTGCGAGPALWRQTSELDSAEYDTLRHLVATGCDSLASKYNFGMGVAAAWKVHSAPCEAAWEDHQQQRQARHKGSTVTRLFHGTTKDAARAILTDGFRLPSHAGMFGRGIYFADTPLKSLQYTGSGWLGGGRFMLVCDVELGHQLQTTTAKTSLSPETDLRRSGVPALLGQQSFDSVAAKPSLFGLRVPEYVVYKPAQVRRDRRW